MANKLTVQFLHYSVAGGIAFICDMAVLYAMTEYLGTHYQISACFAFLTGLAVNYLICVGFIFKYRAATILPELLLFSAIGVIGLLMNAFILFVLTEGLGFYYLVSKICSAALVLMFNFAARRQLLFSDNTHSRFLFGKISAQCNDQRPSTR